MKKCNLIWILLPLLMVSVVGCRNNDDEPVVTPELYLLSSDSLALVRISESFQTESASYPRPWSVADPSSWEGSIELDTLIDSETGIAALTVGALTLYIPEPANPMNTGLTQLCNLRDFKLYACPDATVLPEYFPRCDSILIEKINPEAEGYIKVPEQVCDLAGNMMGMGWSCHKVIINGTNLKMINMLVAYDAIIDLSNNLLEGNVDFVIGNRFTNRVNLSHNKYTGLMGGWESWLNTNVPDLQYNDLQIPEWVLDTDFWRQNHELFIGNPGYQAPK